MINWIHGRRKSLIMDALLLTFYLILPNLPCTVMGKTNDGIYRSDTEWVKLGPVFNIFNLEMTIIKPNEIVEGACTSKGNTVMMYTIMIQLSANNL